MKIREGVYKTERGNVYDFSELDQNKRFQEYLNLSLENRAGEVDIERCKKGIKLFNQRFLKR